MGSPHNTTCNKKTYKSKTRAVEVLTHIHATKTVADFPAGKMPIRAYRCEFCTKWHLTSKKKKKGVPSVIKQMAILQAKATEADYYADQLSKNKRVRLR